jgi:hypothetical protein
MTALKKLLVAAMVLEPNLQTFFPKNLKLSVLIQKEKNYTNKFSSKI